MTNINEGTYDIPVSSPVQQDDYTVPHGDKTLRARIAELEAENIALMSRLSMLSIPEAREARVGGFDMTTMARIAELEAELAGAAIGQAHAQQGLRAAVLAEREACAQIADTCSNGQAVEIENQTYALGSMATDPVYAQSITSKTIAATIRARPAPMSLGRTQLELRAAHE